MKLFDQESVHLRHTKITHALLYFFSFVCVCVLSKYNIKVSTFILYNCADFEKYGLKTVV